MKFIAQLRIVLASGLILATTSASADDRRAREPGEGVACAWALYAIAEEVGNRCLQGQHPEVQAELRRSVARIDEFVLKNASPALTRAEVEQFKREQTEAAVACDPDAVRVFEGFVSNGSDRIRQSTDQLLDRPGNPTWGTCL